MPCTSSCLTGGRGSTLGRMCVCVVLHRVWSLLAYAGGLLEDASVFVCVLLQPLANAWPGLAPQTVVGHTCSAAGSRAHGFACVSDLAATAGVAVGHEQRRSSRRSTLIIVWRLVHTTEWGVGDFPTSYWGPHESM
jgi:hypothetical protein